MAQNSLNDPFAHLDNVSGPSIDPFAHLSNIPKRKEFTPEERATAQKEFESDVISPVGAIGSGVIEGQIGIPLSQLLSDPKFKEKIKRFENENAGLKTAGQIGSSLAGVNSLISKGAMALPGKIAAMARAPKIIQDTAAVVGGAPIIGGAIQARKEAADALTGQGTEGAGERIKEAAKLGLETVDPSTTEGKVSLGASVLLPALMRRSGAPQAIYETAMPPTQAQIKAKRYNQAGKKIEAGYTGSHQRILNKADSEIKAAESLRDNIIDKTDELLNKNKKNIKISWDVYEPMDEELLKTVSPNLGSKPEAKTFVHGGAPSTTVKSGTEIGPLGGAKKTAKIGEAPIDLEKKTKTYEATIPITSGWQIAKRLIQKYQELKDLPGFEDIGEKYGAMIVNLARRGPMDIKEAHEMRKSMMKNLRKFSGGQTVAGFYPSSGRTSSDPGDPVKSRIIADAANAFQGAVENGIKNTGMTGALSRFKAAGALRRFKAAGAKEKMAYEAKDSVNLYNNIEMKNAQNPDAVSKAMFLARVGLIPGLAMYQARQSGLDYGPSIGVGLATGLAGQMATTPRTQTGTASFLYGNPTSSNPLVSNSLKDLLGAYINRKITEEQK